MTKQFTEEQLNAETDAVIIQMNRDQRWNWLKFGAVVVLVGFGAFFVTYAAITIPTMVLEIIE